MPRGVGAENAIDHGLRGAEILVRIEQAREFCGRQMPGDLRIGGENVLERALLGEGALGGGLDEIVGGKTAEDGAERHLNRFCEDETASELEIFRHFHGVEFERGDGVCEVMQRAGGERKDFGECFPLGVPAANAAFLLFDHRGEHRGNEAGNAQGAGERYGGGDGIAFVRHGGRATAAFAGRLEDFRDFRLHVERNIAADFSERAGEEGERGGQFGHAVAVRMPGQIGNGEIEFGAERFGDVQTFVAESGERPDGTAKLQNKGAAADFLETEGMAIHGVEPACGNEPEGGGQSLLHPGAGGDGSVAIFAREIGKRGGEAIGFRTDGVEGAASLEDEAAIDGVLAGGAPVDKARGVGRVFRDQGSEIFDQRNGRAAGGRGGSGDGGGVEEFGAAFVGDGGCGGGGNHARRGFGASEGRFEIEHALETSAIGEELVHGIPAEERTEQSHAVTHTIGTQ